MSRTTTRVITLPRGRDDSLLAIPYGAEPGSTPAKQKEAEPGPRVSLSVSLSLPGPSLSQVPLSLCRQITCAVVVVVVVVGGGGGVVG